MRTFVEIWTASPKRILGIEDDMKVKRFEHYLLKKKIIFNVCLDFDKIDKDGEVGESDEEVLVQLYEKWKEFLKQNFDFFFN